MVILAIKTDVVNTAGKMILEIPGVDGANSAPCQKLIQEHNDAHVNGLEAFLDKKDSSDTLHLVVDKSGDQEKEKTPVDPLHSLLGDVLHDCARSDTVHLI